MHIKMYLDFITYFNALRYLMLNVIIILFLRIKRFVNYKSWLSEMYKQIVFIHFPKFLLFNSTFEIGRIWCLSAVNRVRVFWLLKTFKISLHLQKQIMLSSISLKSTYNLSLRAVESFTMPKYGHIDFLHSVEC